MEEKKMVILDQENTTLALHLTKLLIQCDQGHLILINKPKNVFQGQHL